MSLLDAEISEDLSSHSVVRATNLPVLSKVPTGSSGSGYISHSSHSPSALSSPVIHPDFIDPVKSTSPVAIAYDSAPGSISESTSKVRTLLEQFDPLTLSDEVRGEDSVKGVEPDRTNGSISLKPSGTEQLLPEEGSSTEQSEETELVQAKENSSTETSEREINILEDTQQDIREGFQSNGTAQKPQIEKAEEGEQERPFDFQRFLAQLRHKSADPIARYLKSFLTEFNKRSWNTTEQVKIIGDFKAFIAVKLTMCPPFSTLSEHEMENALEGMEKLIMNRLYSKTFSPEIPPELRDDSHEEDLLRDHILEEKMRIWSWIEGRHLDLADRFLRNGEAFVKLASDELLKITHYRAPRDKVICVLNCCKVIFGLLRQTKSEESADGFLPILIYVVLKAQPKDLISNLNYIQRFRSPDRLNGEAGYYISSLQGAISFIETLDRSALSITDEEFEQNVEKSIREIVDPIKPASLLSPSSSISQPPSTPDRQASPSRANPSSAPSSQRPSTPNGSIIPSAVLYNSAGLLTAPFKTISKYFETEENTAPPEQNETPIIKEDKTQLPRPASVSPQELAARQASAEEHEAQRISQLEFESVVDTLSQMFPDLDREIINDVVAEKQGRVGAAVDICLSLVDSA